MKVIKESVNMHGIRSIILNICNTKCAKGVILLNKRIYIIVNVIHAYL